MSLGETTKCDLSGGKAKVDYAVLIKLLKQYMILQINALKTEADTYNPFDYDRAAFICSVHGKHLCYKVTAIREIAELLETLQEANPFETNLEEKRDIYWV